VLREVVKHECVESVTLVEIDAHVIEAAKKYMPKMAVGFQHPKVSVIVGDGFKYLKDHQSEFDVIITDSSDPEGTAKSLQ
jgi:spermidine synthase